MRGQFVARHADKTRNPSGNGEAVAGVVDRRLQIATERKAAVGRMRLGPTGNRARHGQSRGNNAFERDLVQSFACKPCKMRAGRGAATTSQISDPTGLALMDQPERIATDAGHMRVDDCENRTGSDCGIDSGSAGSQDVHASHRRQRMRRGHHPVGRQSDWPACAYLQNRASPGEMEWANAQHHAQHAFEPRSSRLEVLRSGGRSIAGFSAKKPFGFSMKPAYSTGMTGKSSGLHTCVCPNVCQTTMSSFSMLRFCLMNFGKPSPPAC